MIIAALNTLSRVGAELAQMRQRDEALLLVVETAQALTGATYASLGLVEAQVIHWQTAAGKPLEEVKGYRQPIGEGLCGWVVRQGRARRVNDVRQEPDYFLQYAEMRSELDVPIKAGARVLGVLNVESPEPGAFTEAHEALLHILAAYAAIALAHNPEMA